MQAAACVFDVVPEALTVATNFFRLFKAGSDRLAWVLGACAAGFCLLEVLVVLHVWAKYTLSQWRGLLAVGFLWLGKWQWGSIMLEMVSKQALGALLLFISHYPSQL